METLIKDLKFSRVSNKRVSHFLKNEYKEKRLVAVTKFLQHYKKDEDTFLDSIGSRSERRMHYFTPE